MRVTLRKCQGNPEEIQGGELQTDVTRVFAMRLDSKQIAQKSTQEFCIGRLEKMLMRSVLQFDQEQFHHSHFVALGSSGNYFQLWRVSGRRFVPPSRDSGCPTFMDSVGAPDACWGDAVEISA